MDGSGADERHTQSGNGSIGRSVGRCELELPARECPDLMITRPQNVTVTFWGRVIRSAACESSRSLDLVVVGPEPSKSSVRHDESGAHGGDRPMTRRAVTKRFHGRSAQRRVLEPQGPRAAGSLADWRSGKSDSASLTLPLGNRMLTIQVATFL